MGMGGLTVRPNLTCPVPTPTFQFIYLVPLYAQYLLPKSNVSHTTTLPHCSITRDWRRANWDQHHTPQGI